MNQPPILDHFILNDLAEVANGTDEGFLVELWNSFSEMLERNLSNLYAAVAQENYDDIKAIAHTLKGSALNIGAARVAYWWRLMEKAAHQRDLQEVRSILQLATTAIEQTREEYQQWLRAQQNGRA